MPLTVDKSARDDRDFLHIIFTQAELARLIKAARDGRYGHRDATLILIMARHGLRVSEAVDLTFAKAHLHVRRLKGGTASVHPIQGDELRALRELRRQSQGAFVFASERGGPMTRFNVSKMICWCGQAGRITVLASAYASAYVRPSIGRCGARHTAASVVAGACRHKAHRALQRIEPESVQRVLEMTETNPNVIYLANRIASRAAEHEEWVKKHDKWKEQCWQATLIYSRAIKDMRALGLDRPTVVRLLRAAIEVLEENQDDQ